MLKHIAVVIGLVSAFCVQATPLVSLTDTYPEVGKIIQRLELQGSPIKEAPLDGFVQVDSAKGILYISHNGEFLIQGSLYQIKDGGIENLTQKALFERLNAMQDEMIVYPAKDDRYQISAFVDITCGYCHKLHQDIEELNAAGITVRFLAFPRSDPDSESAKMMAKAWCATDSGAALNQLMAGETLENDGSECEKIIQKQYMLGHQMNISGTPAIVLDDGKVIPGYQPAAALKSYFESREQ